MTKFTPLTFDQIARENDLAKLYEVVACLEDSYENEKIHPTTDLRFSFVIAMELCSEYHLTLNTCEDGHDYATMETNLRSALTALRVERERHCALAAEETTRSLAHCHVCGKPRNDARDHAKCSVAN